MIEYNRYKDPSFVCAYFECDRKLDDVVNGIRTVSLLEWLQPYGVVDIYVYNHFDNNALVFANSEDELAFRLKWSL
jgi:hypothetical protein